jgi:hypothetical protein
MSISSVGSSNPYSYLLSPVQSDGADPTDPGAPSDPLQALYQAFTGGSASDPLLAAIGQDGGLPSSSGAPQLSPDVMQALFSVQSEQGGSASSPLQSLIAKFDMNGDGQISQSEFENAIGPNADQSKVDALFNKLDANGDGSVSPDEMQSAMQKAQGGGGHHHHHHMEAQGSGSSQGGDPLQSLLSGTSADGTTSQSTTNSDGSTTTTITYADGTKIDMTMPALASDGGSTSSGPNAPTFANLLKQLISLQAQLVAPTTNLSV